MVMEVQGTNKGTALAVSWLVDSTSRTTGQGGPHVQYTRRSLGVVPAFGRRFHRAHLPAFHPARLGGPLDHRPPHGPQPTPHHTQPGPGRRLQLPPRPVARQVARPAPGCSVRSLGPAPPGTQEADRVGRRRHRLRAPGQEGLGQGPPPRCRPQQSLVHRLPLGAQVGGAGRPGPLPVHPQAVADPAVGRPVSHTQGQPGGRSPSQDARRPDAADVVRALALVPRPALRLCRRFGLRHARVGPFRAAAVRPAGLGQPLLRRRQPVRAPPPYTGKGRPRVKGDKQPSPRDVVATAERHRLRVRWYGGGWRSVEVVSGVGHWYKGGGGLVAVRWVYVQDQTGTHRDDYLSSTEVRMTPRQIIETYTKRWNIETLFQEARAYLGLETTRGWCQNTVLRAEPGLFGLYGIVALLYEQLPAEARTQAGVDWVGKKDVTFSDAITAVRRWLWKEWVFAKGGHADAFDKLPEPLKETLLYALAPAA